MLPTTRLFLLFDLDAFALLLGRFRPRPRFLVGDILLVGGPHNDQAAVGPWDCAAHEEQVVFLIDLDNVEVAHGNLAVAILTSGEMAFLGPAAAAVRGHGGGAAGLAMDFLGAVGSGHALEIVPFHDARVAAPLARADDVDVLAFLENLVGGQDKADLD